MTLASQVPKWWLYQHEFPDWRVWYTNREPHYHGQLRTVRPPVFVHGKDPEELRREIERSVRGQ
jgi:hypothetical protein